jgi:uncharacterized protein
MTQISATISFVDLRYWNPALAFVMIGGLLVSIISCSNVFSWEKPLLDSKFYHPCLTEIDKKLVVGAVLFGIGWGLVGACPGPLATNVGAGNVQALIVTGVMLIGMWTYQLFFETGLVSGFLLSFFPSHQESEQKNIILDQSSSVESN